MYYHTFVDVQGMWRWRLVAANHESIATSGEGYVNLSDCVHAINLVKTSYNAPIL